MNLTNLSKEQIKQMKDAYKPKDRITLIELNDPYVEIIPFTQGTVKHVDDIGTVHVVWDNGLQLGLVPTVDEFLKLEF